MRKLLWFTLGFGAACAFFAYSRQPLLLFLPAMVLLAAFFTGKQRYHKTILAVAGIALGMLWFSRFEAKILQPVFSLNGITRESTIRCTGFPEETDYGYRVDGTVRIGNRDYALVCYLDEAEAVEPGMNLSGLFRFRVTAPGGLKESTYYQGEGIFLLAYQKDELFVTPGEASWRDAPAKLRQMILKILEDSLPQDTFAFSKALLLGDTSDLDYATKTKFSVSGISHIVAVSGLHVSILFSLLHMVSFRRRFLSAFLTFPMLLLFTAMTGFTPSVSRACIMSGLMLLSMLVNQEYDKETALAFSALVLLVVNPLVVASVSYQLSFASVAGIFLVSPPVRKWILSLSKKKTAGKFWKYLATSVSTTMGATVMTVPFCALYFGSASLAAVLTNLLVLPAVSIIFYGLVFLCLLGSFWSAGGVFFGKTIAVLIRYVLTTAKIIGNFPLSAVYTCSPYIMAWLVFVYALLGMFLLSRNRKPLQLGCCAALGLCLALVLSWAEPQCSDVRFTVLDVGQGQCLLMQSEGRTYMVDCGGSSDTASADAAAETLLSQGITTLDALILTHYDRDHAGGVSNLLTRLDANLLVLPAEYREESYPAGQTIFAAEDFAISSGNTEIRVFVGEKPGNDNENSLCILFDTERCDILITGDRNFSGERLLLSRGDIPDVDVLVAGHHGSKYATGDELLSAVRPEIVCISAGKNNIFGHPAKELLQRLQDHGCAVYRTDLQGDIVIRR